MTSTSYTRFISVRRSPAQRFLDKRSYNRQTQYHGLHEYSATEIAEYPETGARAGEKIAHVFNLDPKNLHNPLYNIQYSKGGRKNGGEAQGQSQGGFHGIRCNLIPDPNGNPNGALCYRQEKTCQSCFLSIGNCDLLSTSEGLGVKKCTFSAPPHAASPPKALSNIRKAKKEVFLKTLGLFGALKRRGCSHQDHLLPDEQADLPTPTENESTGMDLERDDAELEEEINDLLAEERMSGWDSAGDICRDIRSRIKPRCSGRIVMEKLSDGLNVVR